MRIFSAGLGTETNTFSPLPTGLNAFKDGTYFAAGTHPEKLTNYGAPMWVARQQPGWTVLEGLVTGAQPGGTTTRETYETLREQILADLRAAMPVDIVLLGLHGAMVAEGYDDCEGDLLDRVRQIVGNEVVVGAELDPHAHLSELMVDRADILVAYKEYPHTDVLPRAVELVNLCRALAEGRIAPVAAMVDTGMVVPMHTSRDPARAFVDKLMALEKEDGILSISAIQGFATGDVPSMGCKMLVYTDAKSGDAAEASVKDGAHARAANRAQSLARSLADELIAARDALNVRYRGIDEAIDEALAQPGATVVLADRADNPGSGAAGDSTFILQRLIERGIEAAALGPLWDPIAVEIAFAAGVGATLSMRIGGKIGPMSGAPVDAVCKVKALIRDMEMTQLTGSTSWLGDSALIEVDGVDVVVITKRSQALNIDLFTQLGVDLSAKKIVVVKSAQHFHASFSTVASHIVYVGAPGSATPKWHELTYRKAVMPKWPIA